MASFISVLPLSDTSNTADLNIRLFRYPASDLSIINGQVYCYQSFYLNASH